MQNSRKQGFSYHFCLMIEGSGSGHLTSVFGSGWPKTYPGTGSKTLCYRYHRSIWMYSDPDAALLQGVWRAGRAGSGARARWAEPPHAPERHPRAGAGGDGQEDRPPRPEQDLCPGCYCRPQKRWRPDSQRVVWLTLYYFSGKPLRARVHGLQSRIFMDGSDSYHTWKALSVRYSMEQSSLSGSVLDPDL